ncbi:hypothetical protein [Xenorhabdus anantnagensis]|uniref:Adhesin n=1 Tax=Xenorhabdus anantnagensis TaxID=3025875 RepID=A0ABT5LS76_9GAMM|nr:hypothetical protein [Xenorhabdus anantnagensis]MDC9596571.1 hypothetical protein [Xenorhabdus anantnagensis]
MKFKIILIILIATATTMNNYAYSYAGNCDKNLNKQGYVTSVFLGVDDNKDARITFGFNPINSKNTITISLYNYITSTDNKLTFDSNASKKARAAYSLFKQLKYLVTSLLLATHRVR